MVTLKVESASNDTAYCKRILASTHTPVHNHYQHYLDYLQRSSLETRKDLNSRSIGTIVRSSENSTSWKNPLNRILRMMRISAHISCPIPRSHCLKRLAQAIKQIGRYLLSTADKGIILCPKDQFFSATPMPISHEIGTQQQQ